jgi:CHAD domain-containing protein
MADELERVRKAIRELGKSLVSLPANPPPKDVHNLRTAARRVEAIAAVLAPDDRKKSRLLLKPIEPVRKAAGDLRDMDVLIANARRMARHSAGGSLARLVGHLEGARNESAAELQRTLGRRRKAARNNLKQYSKLVKSALAPAKSSAPNADHAGLPHDGVHTAAMNVVRELGEWPRLDASNIHAFRLKVKELRYVLQLYADADAGFVEALGDVQRRIGDWHDWQQMAEIAHAMLDPERDGELLTRIDGITKRKLDRALAAANALRGRHLAMPVPQGI